ncbi:hypothetical protein [Streptomyces sp. NPDC059761]|uniref:hypothetical protein n=1 Tax=Streptomyces sp. NPDC059761 TaxID=3346937 RepID=UPI0036572828
MESDGGFGGGAEVLPEVEAVGHLDRVVNHAGVARVPFPRTAAGLESPFGINDPGTIALTGLMRPHPLASPDPRAVTDSSQGPRFAHFDPDDLSAERHYRAMSAYPCSPGDAPTSRLPPTGNAVPMSPA